MKVVAFQPTDRDDVPRLCEDTFGPMHLARFLWQPCQQIESLEKDGVKLVWKDKKIKGYAAADRLDALHFRLNLIVDPRATKQGIGSVLLNEIEAKVSKQGGRHLQARLLEAMEPSLRFALRRGFTEVHRMRGMSLRAGDFSYEKWRPLGNELAEKGFHITTLRAEMGGDNDPISKLTELQRHAREGWPSPDPTWETEKTTDHLRSFFTGISVPERFSIMKFKQDYVGYTTVVRKNTLRTAVHPDYRGLGMATYLKACNIKMCIDAGQEYFETSSANPAMLRVNEKLGYRFNGLAEVRLVKHL